MQGAVQKNILLVLLLGVYAGVIHVFFLWCTQAGARAGARFIL